MTGARIIVKVTDELAKAPVDIRAILATVTTTLSWMRSGSWMGLVMNSDPTTSLVVVADQADRATAAYIEKFIAAIHQPRVMPTIGLSQRVIEAGTPVLMTNVSPAELFDSLLPPAARTLADHPPTFGVETLGFLIVPMRSRGASVGALGVFDWHCADCLTDLDIDWLQVVADRTGAAIDYAQLHSAAIYRLERLAALRNVLHATESSQDLRLTLQVIVERVAARLQVDAADILVLNGDQTELSICASVGFQSVSIPNQRIKVDPEHIDPTWLRSPGEIMTKPVGIGHQQRRSLFAREGFRSFMALPLVARNTLLGVVDIFHRSNLAPDQEWFDFLDALASVAAIAVDNSAMQRSIQINDLAEPLRRRDTIPPDLSPLEIQILRLATAGLSNRQISAEIHLSYNTIKFHVRQILRKAGVANRTELARNATRQGWL